MICDGRVVIVTGAGRGLGRDHALEFARQGARVVVNDKGTTLEGTGSSVDPAEEVVGEIRSLGGHAVADHTDVTDWHQARRMVGTAIDTYGGLDVVVNSAGVRRDRRFDNLGEEDWDIVIKVHLKGQVALARWAADYWRDRARAGRTNDARIINTSASTGFFGAAGQAAYAAASGGVLALTLTQAEELARFGVTANAIVPSARTRMTEEILAETGPTHDQSFDAMLPENVSPLVVWLGSADSSGVSGRFFEVEGGRIGIAYSHRLRATVDKGARWDPAQVGPAVRHLLEEEPSPPRGTSEGR